MVALVRISPLVHLRSVNSRRTTFVTDKFSSSTIMSHLPSSSTPSSSTSHRPFSSAPRQPREPSYRVMTAKTISPAVMAAQYAVRGAIPLRSEELREMLEAGDKSLPFDTVVNCNIGNPQQLDQQPLTFLRQVSFSSPSWKADPVLPT